VEIKYKKKQTGRWIPVPDINCSAF